MAHGDIVNFRVSAAVHRALETAVRALGTTKSQYVRAVLIQSLRHEPIARAAIEELDRPEFPRFTDKLA